MTKSLSANFSPETAKALEAVLAFALRSERSDFYRRKYAAAAPKAGTLEEFRAIPALSREELAAVPWRQRLFVPESELGAFGISSGTTGLPLVIPRLPNASSVVNDEDLAQLGIDTVMVLMPPFAGVLRHLANNSPKKIKVIPGDIRAIPLSAVIAAEVGVKGMVTTYSGLDRVIDAYDGLGLDLGALKWVSVGGEPVSKARYAYMRALLPGAHFNIRFNASEFGPLRFYRCAHLDADPNLFHPRPGYLFEILDADGRAADEGAPGELVNTDLIVPKAFPFIRYRTGDGAALTGRACPCGNPWLLRMSGRLGFGSLKYAGINLKEEMIEKALERVSDFVKPDFRLHLREETVDGRPIPAIELVLVPKDPRLAGPARAELEGRLAALISSCLYISASRTLEIMEKEGLFRPLKVTLADAFPGGEMKPRRLMPHF